MKTATLFRVDINPHENNKLQAQFIKAIDCVNRVK